MRSQHNKRKRRKNTRRHRMRGGALKAYKLPIMADMSWFKDVDKVRDFMTNNNANAKTKIDDYISILRFAIYYNNPDVVDYVLNNFNLMDANTVEEQRNFAIRHTNLLFLTDELFHTAISNDAANSINKQSEEYASARKKIISLLIAKGASVGRLAHVVKWGGLHHNVFARHAIDEFERYQPFESDIEARKSKLSNQVQQSRKIERLSKGLDRANRSNPLAIEDMRNHVYSFLVPSGTKYMNAPSDTKRETDAIKQMRSNFANI